MSILFNNDDDDKKENKKYGDIKKLPSGFNIKNNTIYDTFGNKVSLKYQDITYPKAKLGASELHLIEKNGFFIPKNNKHIAWKKGLIEATSIHNSISKGYLEAVYDHHGKCPKNISSDYNLRKDICKFGGKEMYGGESISFKEDSPDRSTAEQIINNTLDKSENEEKELIIDYDNMIIVLKAYVSGILVEGSQDWIALSTEYEKLFEVIDEHISKQNPIKSLRYAESFISIHIPSGEYNKIKEYSTLNKKHNNDERLSKLKQKLERELLDK